MPASLTFLRRFARVVLLVSRSNRSAWLRRWIEQHRAACNWEHRARCSEESLDLERRLREVRERDLELLLKTARGLADLRRQRRLPASVIGHSSLAIGHSEPTKGGR